MDDSTDCTNFFAQNADIAGIGVRVAFYIQTTVAVIQTILRTEEGVAAFWTLVPMSFGLMLAAVVSASQHRLSFFNAVQVQNLVCFANAALVQIALMRWRHVLREQRTIDKIYTWFSYIHHALAGSLLIALWVSGENFGPDTSCTQSMHFYVMFWQIRGPHPFHGAEIATFVIYVSLILLPVAVVMFLYITTADKRRFGDYTSDPEAIESIRWARSRSRFLVCWAIPMCIYVAPIELSLHQNSHPTSISQQWTFGQILALIAIVPSLAALCLTFNKFLQELFRELIRIFCCGRFQGEDVESTGNRRVEVRTSSQPTASPQMSITRDTDSV